MLPTQKPMSKRFSKGTVFHRVRNYYAAGILAASILLVSPLFPRLYRNRDRFDDWIDPIEGREERREQRRQVFFGHLSESSEKFAHSKYKQSQVPLYGNPNDNRDPEYYLDKLPDDMVPKKFDD